MSGRGFFAGSTLDRKVEHEAISPRCGACGLKNHCTSPKMQPTGKGARKILIVGEAPGEEEDRRGIPFVGESGRLLQKLFRKMKHDLNQIAWRTNAIICHPEGNATPTPDQISHCAPNLRKTIRDTKPNVIIPLGTAALRAVVGPIWKEDPGGIMQWAGFTIPNQNPNAWICPTFHPAFVLREEKKRDFLEARLYQHLRQAVRLSVSEPWSEPRDYEAEIEPIFDSDAAYSRLGAVFRDGGPFAFDLETTSLKPEHEGAEIVSCSVSLRGRDTFAFLWTPKTAAGMKRLAHSKAYKIAQNLKFEERFIRHAFKRGVRNWIWDTQLAAHILDERHGITGLKFQSYVHLGAVSYDDHIKKYLRAKGDVINRIKEEIDVRQLLVYNGLDSLLEYELALIQSEQMDADVHNILTKGR